MSLRNFKFLAAVLILVLIFLSLGASICLAGDSRPCCPDQNKDCPVVSFEKTPRTVGVNILKPVFLRFLVVIPLRSYLASTAPVFHLEDHSLSGHHFRLKRTPPPHAPPRA